MIIGNSIFGSTTNLDYASPTEETMLKIRQLISSIKDKAKYKLLLDDENRWWEMSCEIDKTPAQTLAEKTPKPVSPSGGQLSISFNYTNSIQISCNEEGYTLATTLDSKKRT